MSRPPRRRVYVANTGGTIGMKPTAEGYGTSPGFLARELARMPELGHETLPEIHLEEYDPLLDSANMSPADWVRIAEDIVERYDDFDAFVVLHGTDTMAYTASALSYMLQNLSKTVILTGSQIPLCEVRNDARDNLVTSLLLAGEPRPIPEVAIFFDQKLLRGNRSRKVHAGRLDAFDSPNFPPLAIAGIDLSIRWDLIRPRVAAPLVMRPISSTPLVGQMRVFPGISASIVRNFLAPPIQGLVIETYGVGNAPARDRALMAEIGKATRRGVVVVSCTQCIRGSVDLEGYATGQALAKAGVISGLDMTPEAALTKLFYLFSLHLAPEEVRRRMSEDLRGELTHP